MSNPESVSDPSSPGAARSVHAAPQPADAAPIAAGARRWYLAGIASYFVPGGIQAVLFPYMVTVVLGAGAAELGFAQMTSQLPSLCLLLFTGVLADRVDPRRILLVVHLLAGIPALALTTFVLNDALAYPVLLVYALIGGTMTAFAMPARDALLNRVAGHDLQRTVAMAMGAQFGVQIIGYTIAASADAVGLVPVLIAQGAIMIAGALTALRLPAAPDVAVGAPARRHPLRDLVEGIATVLGSPRMRPAWLLTVAMGAFFAGAFIVIMPMAVRTYYNGTAADISMGFLSFMVGTLISVAALMALGDVRRQGRAVMVAMILGALLLLPMGMHPPQWAFYALMFVWGMGGGVSMTVTRAVMQQAAPPAQRGRVMASYSLANMGAMPLGSVLMGTMVDWLGVERAVIVPCVGVLVTVLAIHLTSGFWRMQPDAPTPSIP